MRTKKQWAGPSSNDSEAMSTGNVAAVVPTAPLHGYQVIFSPYSAAKLAFVGASNYGIAGG